jgi:hypothetical protein
MALTFGELRSGHRTGFQMSYFLEHRVRPNHPIRVIRSTLYGGRRRSMQNSMALFQHTPPRDRARDTARGYAAIRLSIFPIEVPADAGKEVQSAVLLVHGAPALTLSG